MSKMKLFTKTDTTLVYIASAELAEEIMKEYYHKNATLYIHVGRDTGFVIVYEDNDIRNVVLLEMKEQEYILKCAEIDR